jgi:hypothetical protein
VFGRRRRRHWPLLAIEFRACPKSVAEACHESVALPGTEMSIANVLRRIESSGGGSSSKDPSERRRKDHTAAPPAPPPAHDQPVAQGTKQSSALRAAVRAHRRAEEVVSTSRRDEFLTDRASALRASSAPSGAGPLAAQAPPAETQRNRVVLSPVQQAASARVFARLTSDDARPRSASSRLMTAGAVRCFVKVGRVHPPPTNALRFLSFWLDRTISRRPRCEAPDPTRR